MARAQTTAAAMVAPCSTRHITSQPMLPASMLPMLAAVYSTSPVISTGRRPTRSATGPQNSCPTPKARISADIVSCAALMGAPELAREQGQCGQVDVGGGRLQTQQQGQGKGGQPVRDARRRLGGARQSAAEKPSCASGSPAAAA